MKPYRVGLDIDGVLANFVDAWSRHIAKHTGKVITLDANGQSEWNWDTAGGLTKAEESQLWKIATQDPHFWDSFKPLPTATNALDRLELFTRTGDIETYFITARRGVLVKRQTERWLRRWGVEYPTVLLAEKADYKAEFALDLELDAFVDDNPENLKAVHGANPATSLYVADAPYNRVSIGKRVPHVGAFVDAVTLTALERNARR